MKSNKRELKTAIEKAGKLNPPDPLLKKKKFPKNPPIMAPITPKNIVNLNFSLIWLGSSMRVIKAINIPKIIQADKFIF